MADDKAAALPDGTDTVIAGASKTSDGGTVTAEDTALVTEREIPAPRSEAERPVTGKGSPDRGLADRFRQGGVGVDRELHFLHRVLVRAGDHELVQDLRRMRADDMRA